MRYGRKTFYIVVPSKHPRHLGLGLIATETLKNVLKPQVQPNVRMVRTTVGLTFDAEGFGAPARMHFYVRVFNPLAASNRKTPLSSVYRRNEQEKCREYDQRIREIEHGSFAPLVFTASGGMGALYHHSLQEDCLSVDQQQMYSTTMWWLCCQLSFSLLRSTITAMRGTRVSALTPTQSIPLAMAEGRIA